MQGAGQDAGVIGIFGRVGYMLEGFPKLKNALHGALSRCQTLEEQVGTLTESLATTSSNLATTQEALAATQGSLRQAEEEVGVRVDQMRIKDQEIKRLGDGAGRRRETPRRREPPLSACLPHYNTEYTYITLCPG